MANDLEAGKNDVLKIFEILTDRDIVGCDKTNSKKIIDCASVNEFKKTLEEVLSTWDSSSQLVFYFSGHGVIKSEKFFLKFGMGESLFNNLFDFTHLIEFFKDCKVGKAIIIIDACHSGKAAKNIKSSNLKPIKTSLPSSEEIPTGISILASSRANQFSEELEDGSHSVFTKLLHECLKNGLGDNFNHEQDITPGLISDYVNIRLKNTEYEQQPIVSIGGASGKIILARNRSYIGDSVITDTVSNESQLRILYENTAGSEHPCVGATVDGLDAELLEEYFFNTGIDLRINPLSLKELLEKHHFYSKITLKGIQKSLHKAAVLCFHLSPQDFYRGAFVKLEFDETNKESNDFKGNLVNQSIEVFEEIKNYLLEIKIRDQLIINLMREVVTNAIIHRNYDVNIHTTIKINPQRLIIINPGIFEYFNDWRQFLEHEISAPANPAITQYISKLMRYEGVGRGFRIIKDYLKKYGKDSIEFTTIEQKATKLVVRFYTIDDAVKEAELQHKHIIDDNEVSSDAKLLSLRTRNGIEPCFEANIESLDWNLLERFFNSKGEELPKENRNYLLEKYGMLHSFKTNQAVLNKSTVLSFHNNPQLFYPSTKIVFTAGDLTSEHYIKNDIVGNLFMQVSSLTQKIIQFLPRRHMIDENGNRFESSIIDEALVKDTIFNTIIQRDYSVDIPTQVRVEENVLVIINPGKELQSAWDEKNLLFNNTPKNPLISYFLNLSVGEDEDFSVYQNYLEENGKDSLKVEVIDGKLTKVIIKFSRNIPKYLTSYVPSINPKDVIGRTHKLEELVKSLDSSKKAVVVAGIGGIGKSTLAKLYLAKYRDSLDHIIWLTFNTESFEEMILKSTVPEKLDISRKQISNEILLKLVFNKLSSLNGNNLLVIDNADNVPEIKKYSSLLSLGNSWKVLLTSRSVLPNMELIRVDKLSSRSARDLFLKHYSVNAEDEKVLEALLREVDYHTLTVELLAKTIQKSWSLGLEDLLSKMKMPQLDDPNLREHIWTSNHLSEEEEILAVYSHISACFDLASLNIKEQWMLQQFAVLPSLATIDGRVLTQWLTYEKNAEEKHKLQSLIENLVDKGWLIISRQNKLLFQIHPIIKSLILFRLTPHFENCKFLIKGFSNFIRIDATTQDITGKFMWVEFGEELIKIFGINNNKSTLEEVHTISILYDELGYVYQQQGNFVRSLALKNTALELVQNWYNIYEKDLTQSKNRELENLIVSYKSNLSLVYQDLGEYEEARKLLEDALEVNIRNFNEFSPKVTILQSNLGLIYRELGKYETAKSLLEQALKNDLKNFGESHPEVAIRQSNLGLIYQDLGQYKKAEELFNNSLKISIKNFGESHPEVAIRQSNLGLVYRELGEYNKALELLEKALKNDWKNFGTSHPTVLIRQSNLSLIYRDLKAFDEALDLLQNSLETSERIFEESHPTITSIQSNLSMLYRELGEFEKARELLEKALNSQVKNFGTSHPAVAISQSNLGLVLKELGELEKARSLFEKALENDLKNFEASHPTVAISQHNLATTYLNLGMKQEARQLFQKAYISLYNLLGEEHPNTKTVKNQLDKLDFNY
ncbi:hypothetical protein BKI52_20970 [marine bacterium AO1-C]|nr:hypothetical protein BKI52_20970 [marine bacterium AO1-C]